MSVFRQPWIIVFVILLGGYTYKVLSSAGRVELRPSSAQAGESGPASKASKVVKATKALVVKDLQDIQIQAFESMDVTLLKGVAANIELRLEGEGSRYTNDGSAFAHWLDATVSSEGKLVIVPAYKESSVFGKMDFWSNSDRLKLTVVIPIEKTDLQGFELKTVSGDILVTGLNFKKIQAQLVSGDLTLADGGTDQLSIESVSGDVTGESFSVLEADIKSVSGDVSIRSQRANPRFGVKTVSGDLSLEIPSASEINVTFKSISGELKSQFESEATGLGRVQFSSLSGDAKISKIK